MKLCKQLMIVTILLIAAECISGCHMSIDEEKWATREEVVSYIEEKYPGKTYILADTMVKNRGRREWSFAMDDYPGCKFLVANVPRRNAWIPIYSHTVLIDNVYGVLQRVAVGAFTETIESVYGADALEYWKGIEKDNSMVPILIQINNISQFDVIGQMIADYQNYFKSTYPGFDPAYFTIRMKVCDPVTRLVNKVSNPVKYYQTGLRGGNEGLVWEWGDYSYTDDIANQARIDSMRNNVIEYACIYYSNVAGVTDEMKKDFTQKALHKDEYDFGNIHRESYTVINTKSEPIYAITAGNKSDKLYVTRQTAYELFRQCGLAVSGVDRYRESFSVVGIDGATYNFVQTYDMKKCIYKGVSYDYTIDGEKHSFDDESFDIEHGFEVDSDLIKRITGIDIANNVN